MALPMYVIYWSPKDYPDKFVVREWATARADGRIARALFPMAVVDTLEQARAALPDGLVNCRRDEDDDPAILEVWL